MRKLKTLIVGGNMHYETILESGDSMGNPSTWKISWK